jgi:hypothetical protein
MAAVRRRPLGLPGTWTGLAHQRTAATSFEVQSETMAVS